MGKHINTIEFLKLIDIDPYQVSFGPDKYVVPGSVIILFAQEDMEKATKKLAGKGKRIG